MKIEPTFDNVVVLLDKTELMSAGGIALPQGVVQNKTTGRIVATGPNTSDQFAADMRVILADGENRTQPLDMNGDGKILVVGEKSILAIIKE